MNKNKRIDTPWRLPKSGLRVSAGILTWLIVLLATALPAWAQEPTPRSTPTPQVLLALTPTSGMPGASVKLAGHSSRSPGIIRPCSCLILACRMVAVLKFLSSYRPAVLEITRSAWLYRATRAKRWRKRFSTWSCPRQRLL